MKVAQTADGQLIIASESAPQTAICPRCQKILILRKRRTMTNDIIWFWRHPKQQGFACRHSPPPSRTLSFRN